MKKLVGSHAEDVGGLMVEPGQTFDETAADEQAVKRLEQAGLLVDAPRTKPKTSQEGA